MTPSHLELRWEVGAYVLGALDADEATEFESHMRTCPVCREEARSLSEIPSLLAEFAATGPDLDELLAGTPEAAEPPPAPLAKVFRLRRRRRQFLMLAASVAMFASGLALGGVLRDSTDDSNEHPPWAAHLLMVGEQHRGESPDTGITAKIGLEKKGWGTHIALELRGVAGPLECRLVAVSTDGFRHTVTGWTVPKPGYGIPSAPDPLMVHGGSSLSRSELDRFEVITRDGRQLVGIDL